MPTTTPTRSLLERVVVLACRAPSVHNTQPWRWRIKGTDTLELFADRTRQLAVADPTGRNLAISCGAALHQGHEAGTALGLDVVVELVPESSAHDLLARLHFSAGRPPTRADARLQTLEQRCTDRRRFTSWPVPDSTVQGLAAAATGWGALAVPVTDVTARFRAELLMERAMTLQASDSRFAAEQAAWIDHSTLDGVPLANAVPPRTSRRDERPNRFARDSGAVSSHRVIEGSDGLLAICTAHDDQVSWLRAGETVNALWLEATRTGLSIVPLSQVMEVPETREALGREVFVGAAQPQLLLRVGWQEIARTTLRRTPRRPLAEVLVP
jgi:nitroreductase